MGQGDRGAIGIEYAGLLVFIAGLVAAMVTTDLPGYVGRGAKAALCMIFQESNCATDMPTVASQGSGEGLTGPASGSNPATDFLAGGVGRAWDSARVVGCMLHLCGNSQFQQSWNNAAQAVTVPVRDKKRVRCSDWREAAKGTPPTRPDGSPRQEYTIGTFNMYGNIGHDGDAEPIVPAIVHSVNDRKPVFLALNEVCETQANALAAELGGEYKVYFAPTPKVTDLPQGDPDVPGWITCRNGARFGNAIVYRADFANDVRETAHDLVTPGSDAPGGSDYKRTAPCVSSAAKKVVFCAAHLEARDGDLRKTEATNLRNVLADQYDGYTTMLGGDLNDTPQSDTLDNFYDPRYGGGAQGDLKEVDSTDGLPWDCRTGEPTHGPSLGPFGWRKKLDYILVSDDVEIGWSDSTRSDYSDHDPVWAGVTF